MTVTKRCRSLPTPDVSHAKRSSNSPKILVPLLSPNIVDKLIPPFILAAVQSTASIVQKISAVRRRETPSDRILNILTVVVGLAVERRRPPKALFVKHTAKEYAIVKLNHIPVIAESAQADLLSWY
jgi:hypothetical protein